MSYAQVSLGGSPLGSPYEIGSRRPSGGGTDLSLPFAWASANGVRTDGLLIVTDNETWAGFVR